MTRPSGQIFVAISRICASNFKDFVLLMFQISSSILIGYQLHESWDSEWAYSACFRANCQKSSTIFCIFLFHNCRWNIRCRKPWTAFSLSEVCRREPSYSWALCWLFSSLFNNCTSSVWVGHTCFGKAKFELQELFGWSMFWWSSYNERCQKRIERQNQSSCSFELIRSLLLSSVQFGFDAFVK